MKKGNHTKVCENCDTLLVDVHKSKKYCDKCLAEFKKINQRNANKKRTKNGIFDDQEEGYRENFLKATKNNGYTLTTKGFTEVSEVSFPSYRRYFSLHHPEVNTWVEIVRYYGKYEELYDYVQSEYTKYTDGNKNNSNFLHGFLKQHKYIVHSLIQGIGEEKIVQDFNIQRRLHSESEYEENFNKLKNNIGRIPLYWEFEKYSPIKISTYMNYFGLKGSGSFDKIVKKYASDEEFNMYRKMKIKRKSDLASESSSQVKFTDEELEFEFKKVFDDCFLNCGKYPSRKLFNKLSAHDDSVYRRRFNISWVKICEYYGYEIDRLTNKFESYVLNCISKILNSKFEPQKTFEWLIGINNFPLFCDGYFKDFNLIIETDGVHHKKPVWKFGGYERFEIQQQNDKLKDQLTKENGIKLIRIDIDSDWHDINYLKKVLIENGIELTQLSHNAS